jgi:hypothetical protein
VEGVDGAADCEGAERAGAVKQRIFFGPDLAEAIRAETHEPLIDGLIDKGTSNACTLMGANGTATKDRNAYLASTSDNPTI